MATNTEHYNLKKPDPEDFADIADINGNMDIIDEALHEKADLDSEGKIPAEQLPAMGFIPSSKKGVRNGVAELDNGGKVPSSQLPEMNYIPSNEKGAANGVAQLDSTGKIPASQVGAVGVPPRLTVTVPSGSTVTCSKGATTLTATSTGTAVFDLNDYGTWNVTATKNGQTASGRVTVDNVKLYALTLEYFSATLRVNSDSGAAVSVTGPKSYSATVPSSGSVSFTLEAPGTYSITATKGGETTDPVGVSVTTSGQTYTADCLFFNSTFANNTWAQIAKASTAWVASTLWSVGDTKDIVVNGETLTVEILGFNHDDLAGGGKAGITFGLKNLMASTRQMNSSSTNSGGFTGSEMYTWLQNTLLGQLPADLQAVIKNVNKKTSAGNKSTTINTNSMKLFLFSEIEIFGSTTYSVAGEGSQYSGFATASQRTKYLSNGTGSADIWWERSPYAGNINAFCRVGNNGDASTNAANYARGVCFGFCI